MNWNIVKRKLPITGTQQPKLHCLISTNSPNSFFHTETYLGGLSGCHKLVVSVVKTTCSKIAPKEMMGRDFKNFDQEIFS